MIKEARLTRRLMNGVATHKGDVPVVDHRPTHQEVAARARAIWQSKGCPAGRDVENWREAEEQLRAETTARGVVPP